MTKRSGTCPVPGPFGGSCMTTTVEVSPTVVTIQRDGNQVSPVIAGPPPATDETWTDCGTADRCKMPLSAEQKELFSDGELRKLMESFSCTRMTDLDKHPKIIEIKSGVESGRIVNENVLPEFFDGLYYVMRSSNVRGVQEINLALGGPKDLSANLFLASGVLNELISGCQLQKLTLHGFQPSFVLDSLVTLHCQKGLQSLDLTRNSLTTADFCYFLRYLPPEAKLAGDFRWNRIEEGDRVARRLRMCQRFATLAIIEQETGPLKLNTSDRTIT